MTRKDKVRSLSGVIGFGSVTWFLWTYGLMAVTAGEKPTHCHRGLRLGPCGRPRHGRPAPGGTLNRGASGR